ncbi:MAG: FlaD/FlaE family flagellar protein [Thermoplasmata archaeon]
MEEEISVEEGDSSQDSGKELYSGRYHTVGDAEHEPQEEVVEKYEIRHGIPNVTANTRGEHGRMYKSSKGPVDESMLSDVEEKIKEFSDQLEHVLIQLDTVEQKVSMFASRLDKLEKEEDNHEEFKEKLKELSALYDLLSSDISPFMDMEHFSKPSEEEARQSRDEVSEIERYDMEAMIDWIDFLHKKTGRNIGEVLAYYEELGWIEESLKENILSYSKGIKADISEDGDLIIGEDGEVESDEIDWRLSPEDHKKSLRFIRSIKNRTENYGEEEVSGGE